MTRSAGSAVRKGTSSSIAIFAVAPDNPVDLQATGRLVKRASARAVVAQTVSSPRATPMPETEESSIANMRSNGPAPAINPRCGGCAGGKHGMRRRVRTPCTATNGNSASEPRRPAANLARRPRLREVENAHPGTVRSPYSSLKLTTILIAAALRHLRTKRRTAEKGRA